MVISLDVVTKVSIKSLTALLRLLVAEYFDPLKLP